MEYCRFLIEDMNKLNLALVELEILERSNPSLEIEYLIFAYRELIKEKLMNSGERREDEREERVLSVTIDMDYINESAGVAIEKENQINSRNVVVYQSHFAAFKHKIEKVAFAHSMVWGFLAQDSPDLTRVQTTAFKILFLLNNVQGIEKYRNNF